MSDPSPRRTGLFLRAGLTLLTAALLPAAVRAGESYYVIIFGAQRDIAEPNHTHSWATFVRVCGGPGGGWIEHHTISWLAAKLAFDVRDRSPEPGVNLDLYGTLNWALGDGQHLSMWGPFQIEPELYFKAMQQIGRLSSGAVQYKAVDFGYRTERVSNCIHAVSDLAGAPRARVVIPGYGQTARRVLTARLRKFMIEPRQTHPWVADALGLNHYPIRQREVVPVLPTVLPRLRGGVR
jgi:hypothetical protein